MEKQRCLLIADDLTGGADAGAQFAEHGMKSLLIPFRGKDSSTYTVAPGHGKAGLVNSVKRHKHILAAIRKRGEEAACSALFAIIDSFKREIVSRIDEVGWTQRRSAEPLAGGVR